jgi:5,5'-dehydrodivanillate O-demethylase oxygenase subunit
MKRRLLEGDDPETSPDWNIGHPMLFPNILAGGALQWRVPIDDGNTLHVTYFGRPRPLGAPPQTIVPSREVPIYDAEGEFILSSIVHQDYAAWLSQGRRTPRQLEHLSRSDLGVTMLRQGLSENIAKVERGEDPGAVIRDPAINEPVFVIPGMSAQRLTSLQTMTPLELTAKLEAAAAARSVAAV